MKTKEQLHQLEESQLIHEILCLQKIVEDRKIEESKCSAIHNYHFASNEIIKLTKDRWVGSALIFGGIYDLKGKLLVNPVTISDGLSNSTINSLLDDLADTYNKLVAFKPNEKRLK